MNTPAPQLSPAKVAAPAAQLLTLEQVLADPNQPRKAFDDAALKELADSIRADGILSPILVKPNGKGFYIVDGERRFRAAKLAGLKEVPVIVRADLKDQDVTALQLVANLQREDLTLPEQCDAVARLVKTLGTARAAAEKLGKSEAWVSKRAGAESFAEPVKKLLKDGKCIDIEIAAGVNELMSVDADAGKRMVSRIIADSRHEEPTISREEVRNQVRWSKEAKERQARIQREQAVAAKEPKAVATQEKEDKENAKHREREAAVKALNKACEQFAEQAMNALLPAIGFKVPKAGPMQFGDYLEDRIPLIVASESYNYSRWSPKAKFPAGVSAAKFGLCGWGGAEHIEKVTKLFGEPKIQYFGVAMDDYGVDVLTLEYKDAIAVLKLLKHHKGLGANFQIEMTGAELCKLVEKHTGKPLQGEGLDKLLAATAKPATKKTTKKKR